MEYISVICMVLMVLAITVAWTNALGVIGFFIGFLVSIVVSALVFGLLFLMIENNQNLREIRKILSEQKGEING